MDACRRIRLRAPTPGHLKAFLSQISALRATKQVKRPRSASKTADEKFAPTTVTAIARVRQQLRQNFPAWEVRGSFLKSFEKTPNASATALVELVRYNISADPKNAIAFVKNARSVKELKRLLRDSSDFPLLHPKRSTGNRRGSLLREIKRRGVVTVPLPPRLLEAFVALSESVRIRLLAELTQSLAQKIVQANDKQRRVVFLLKAPPRP